MTDSPIFLQPSVDPEMEEAASKARQTFRFFWRELSWEQRRIVPGLLVAAVKVTFEDPPELQAQNAEGLEKEHMWLLDVDFDGQNVRGTLINSPSSLKSVKEGDQINVGGGDVCDWMYAMGETVYGGFTVDLLRSRMGPGERKQHDKAWGLDFGMVGVVNLVPPEYIGDEVPKKGILSMFSRNEQSQQDYAEVAAREHPMSINMRSSLEQQLAANPTQLHEADENGFTFLHQLALAGSLDGVDVCLNCGADPNRPAHNGLMPFALAKNLGWKRVMARLQKSGGR